MDDPLLLCLCPSLDLPILSIPPIFPSHQYSYPANVPDCQGIQESYAHDFDQIDFQSFSDLMHLVTAKKEPAKKVETIFGRSRVCDKMNRGSPSVGRHTTHCSVGGTRTFTKQFTFNTKWNITNCGQELNNNKWKIIERNVVNIILAWSMEQSMAARSLQCAVCS